MSGMQFNIRLANLKMDAPFCAVCRVALPSSSQRRSLTPEASASNKRAVEFLVTVINPELELPAGGPVAYCCKPCFSKLEKAERSFEAAKRIINELRSTFSLAPVIELFGVPQQTNESTDDEKQMFQSRIRAPAPLESEQRIIPRSHRKRSRIEDGQAQEHQAKKKYCSQKRLDFSPRTVPSQQSHASPQVQVSSILVLYLHTELLYVILLL